MSNYSKTTNFATKDSLASGNPLKVIKGTEIDDEFESLETAIATKADLVSPILTGTPTAPTATNATSSTQIATTAFVKNVIGNGGYVARAGIAADAIDGTKIADDVINSEHYVAGSIDNEHLADSSVTSAKIANGTIVSADIASNTITSSNIASSTVTGSNISTNTITASNIAANAIGASELADNAVDTNAIANGAVTLAKLASSALSNAYPVGSVYINASVSTNPATLLGFGTWVSFGAGRVLVGVDSGDASFDTLGETGGTKDAIVVSHTHTGSTNTTGSHDHDNGIYNRLLRAPYAGSLTGNDTVGSGTEQAVGGGDSQPMVDAGSHSHTFTTNSTGSSGTNANLQPYITVYMWKRTA